MRRWFTTAAAVLICSAALHADVTIVQTTTIEGGMAAMAANAGANVTPKTTMRIKGLKARNDVEAGVINIATIFDIATKQAIVLRVDQKTATIMPVPVPGADAAAAAATAQAPTVDASAKPTGKSQVIDGITCDEYAFTSSVDMSSMSSSNMPPEAAAMMQGIKVNVTGSVWIAKDVPGAAEYIAFQKAAIDSNLVSAIAGASGMNIPGMDKLMKATTGVNGVAYLTEATINIDGTGQMAEMMRQGGPMKVTTKVTSVSAGALSDDLFKVPEGYTIVK